MTYDEEPLYWQTNKEWYKVIDDKPVLTDKATERARESFELYNSKDHKL